MKITELHPDQAVTIFSSVKLVREHPTRALTPIDLENHISQAVWRFFDRCRGEAAAKLGIREVELALSDVRITGVRLDGHQVINPIGFTGREFEVGLSQTVTKKEVVSDNSYLVEGGSMRAYMLAKLLGLGRAFFVESGDKTTSIFIINGSDIRHFSSFQWGGDNIVEALGQHVLEADRDILSGLYRKYAKGGVSDKLERRIDKPFYQALTPFVNGVFINIRNAGGMRFSVSPSIYFHPRFPVPDGVYRKHFSFGNNRLKLLRAEEGLDIEKFINENIHGVYEELNELAARRIKWLMPTE